MEIDANFRLMFVSVGTYEQAKRIAEVLISKNLIACCSIISGIESMIEIMGRFGFPYGQTRILNRLIFYSIIKNIYTKNDLYQF